MKRLYLKISLIFLIFFVIIALAQELHKNFILRRWSNQDLRSQGRSQLAEIIKGEGQFWDAKFRWISQTAGVFSDILTRPYEAGESPVIDSGRSLRQILRDGEQTLGVYVADRGAYPEGVGRITAAFPQLKYYLRIVGTQMADVFFISKDNWIVVSPARWVDEIEDGHDFRNDVFFRMAALAENPGKKPRLTSLYFDDIWDRWIASVVAPVYAGDEFLGVAGANVPAEQLRKRVAEYPPFAAGNLFVTDSQANVILHRDLRDVYRRRDFEFTQGFAFNGQLKDSWILPIIEALRRARFPDQTVAAVGDVSYDVFSGTEPSGDWRYTLVLNPVDRFVDLRRSLAALSRLNFFAVLILFVLFFFFLKGAILSPISEINSRLAQFQLTETGKIEIPRFRFFKEIRHVFSHIELIFSQLKKNANEAKASKEYVETLMRTAQMFVIVWDKKLNLIYLNDYALNKLQLKQEEIGGQHISDFIDSAFIHEAMRELLGRDNIISRETVLLLRTGERMDIAVSISKLLDDLDQVGSYIAVIADITKRKKAEINLRNQIAFSQQIFQSIPEMIVITDKNLRITFVNKQTKDFLKGFESRIIGQMIHQLLSKKSLKTGFDELVRNVIDKGQSIHQINMLNPFLEEENFVDLIIEPLRSETARIGAVILLRDISEWRVLTAQLRTLQGFLQKLVNASPYAVISINPDAVVTVWNQTAERLFHINSTEAFGKNLYELAPLFINYRDLLNEVMILQKTTFLKDEKIFVGDEDFIVANLTVYPVTAEQNSVVINIEDVSEIKKLETSLLQAQKMESLGVLTSGIIHDFNNVLSGILGYASLLDKKMERDSKLKKYVNTIISSSERASAMINQILNFSRRRLAEKEVININDLIREAIDFISMNLRHIRIDLQLWQAPLLLSADKTKISQVIINLLINARDALENSTQPVIRITTKPVSVSAQANLLEGSYVFLEVGDNGSGIAAENLNRIFEPFFTTKGPGKGTGLGLAIVREIVRDYSGDIAVRSEVNRGTLFTLHLPLFEKETQIALEMMDRQAEPQIRGTTLLIDDEEVVREIGVEMLKAMGIQCLTAADGEEGLKIFKERMSEIDLVILDIEMPGISGERVFQLLRELNPDIKILIASGYSQEYLEANVFKGKIDYFIAKPFKFQQLLYQLSRFVKS